jgi:hypothetical protein
MRPHFHSSNARVQGSGGGGGVQAGGGEASGCGGGCDPLEWVRGDGASLGGTCGRDGERQQSAEELQG